MLVEALIRLVYWRTPASCHEVGRVSFGRQFHSRPKYGSLEDLTSLLVKLCRPARWKPALRKSLGRCLRRMCDRMSRRARKMEVASKMTVQDRDTEVGVIACGLSTRLLGCETVLPVQRFSAVQQTRAARYLLRESLAAWRLLVMIGMPERFWYVPGADGIALRIMLDSYVAIWRLLNAPARRNLPRSRTGLSCRVSRVRAQSSSDGHVLACFVDRFGQENELAPIALTRPASGGVDGCR